MKHIILQNNTLKRWERPPPAADKTPQVCHATWEVYIKEKPTGLSGGLATFVLVIYSFASDNSSARFCNLYSIHMVYVFYIFNHFRDRYVRIAVAGWMWDLAYFIAMPLGAWLYNTGGYVLNFGTAVIIYAFACIIGLVKLRGFKEKIKKHDLTIKGKSIN